MKNDNSITIQLIDIVGTFAENKDLGRDIRVNMIEPALKEGKTVVIDFNGIEGATQSFIHSMISQVIRDNGNTVLELIFFKNCSDSIRAIIDIVVDYMQQTD